MRGETLPASATEPPGGGGCSSSSPAFDGVEEPAIGEDPCVDLSIGYCYLHALDVISRISFTTMIKRYAALAIIYVLSAVELNAQNGWVAMEDSLRNKSIASMACDSMGRLYALAFAKTMEWKGQYVSYYNLYRSAGRGHQWESINGQTLDGKPLVVSPLGSVVVGGLGISTWPDGIEVEPTGYYRGANDAQWSNAGGEVIAADFSNPGLYVVGIAKFEYWSYRGGVVLCSRDSGRTWSSSPIPVAVADLCVTSTGEIIVGASNWDDAGTRDGAIYRSIDSGATWSVVRDSVDVARIIVTTTGSLLAEAIDRGDDWNHGYRPPMIIRSDDRGITWSKVLDSVDVTDMIARQDLLLFTGVGPNVPRPIIYRSTDDGMTWEKSTEPSITPLTRNQRGTLFGRDREGGIYRSEDGESWTQYLPPPPYSYDHAAFAIDRDGYIYVGTNGHGVYRSERSSSVERAAGFPTATLRLDAITPNPAGNRAVISFATPMAEHVRLELHDLLGEDVATLHDARLEAGEHRITLDATGLASGPYLCRLTAGGAVATKIVIVR